MPLNLPSNLTHEDRLMVAACRRESVGNVDLGELVAPFASTDRVQSLIDRLDAHRVPGLVLSSLKRHGLFDLVDPNVGAVLQTHLLRHRWRSAQFALELKRLARSLEGVGIEVVALKGASLGPSVYRCAAERFLGDLDLLVRPDQVDAALGHFLAHGYSNPWSDEALRGYRTYHYHLPLTRPDGIILELHWDLVKPDRTYRLDPLGVVERSIPLPGPPTTLRMPCVEDQILHAVVQQLQDGFTYFSRTVDLDRLVATGRTDWDVLCTRARENRLGPALAYAMQVARHLLATDCPAEVVGALWPGRLARTHLSFFDPVRSALDQRFVGHPTHYNLLRLWLTQGHARRLSILTHLVREMQDHEPEKEPWRLIDRQTKLSGRHGFVGLAKLGKMVLAQIVTYLRTIIGLPTRRFRAQMRFWSSRPSSSERS